MNVYDFDKTIYSGDSTLDFWKHCIRKYPKAILAFPKALLYGMCFKLGVCGRERWKEVFYGFLWYVPDTQKEAKRFWDTHMNGIKTFYRERQSPDDLVISASPEFLIGEVCRRLGIAWIASPVNPATGKLEGPNCRGEEKVRRFQEEYPEAEIECFYSDSPSDIFMAREAQKAFLVKKDRIQEWSI